MNEYSQKYVIVALLEHAQEGYEFTASTWPLHVTIAGTFAIEWKIERLIDELLMNAKSFKQANTTVSHDEYFGPKKNLPVAILQENTEVKALHSNVIKLLKEAGVKFNDPQYNRAGYRAHCTVQSHDRINVGEKVTLKNLAIVDMFVNNDYRQRKILKIVELS